MEAIVKTRKEHKCCYCNGTIKIGEWATVYSGRQPRFDKNENQVGIEYFKIYLHIDIEKCDIESIEQ